jgi:hypothetical protein
MRLLCLILFSLVSLYGCQEKLDVGCGDSCTVTSGSESVDITYYSTNAIALADSAYFEPASFVTHNNNFTCSIPQTLIDAGFSISSECIIYGTPLKTLSGNFIVTILDFETAQDKSVLIAINVFDGGTGCGTSGWQVTIADYPAVGSPDFSFCVEGYEHIASKADQLGISLPGNGCQGTCTASLSLLESGTLDQSEQTFLNLIQQGNGYVLYDVAYPTSDLTLNLSPPPL